MNKVPGWVDQVGYKRPNVPAVYILVLGDSVYRHLYFQLAAALSCNMDPNAWSKGNKTENKLKVCQILCVCELYVFICMYVFVHVCMHVCVHVCMYVYEHVRVRVCVRACVQLCVVVILCVCMYKHHCC